MVQSVDRRVPGTVTLIPGLALCSDFGLGTSESKVRFADRLAAYFAQANRHCPQGPGHDTEILIVPITESLLKFPT
jgi:hypothetical protein